MDRYPFGWDYAWLGVDAVGRIAIFTNAGVGPIPNAVIADREQADRAEGYVRELPERGGYQLLVELPRPDDYIAFAKRGLFAYDWATLHREGGIPYRYELLSRPEDPVLIDDLPARVSAIASKVRFASLRFEEVSVIVGGWHW